MPRTGSVFTLTPSTVAPAVAGTPASAPDFNAAMDDISQALSDSMVTDAPAFTSPASFDGGTEDAPGITFTGDLDTGIWHPAANQVGITVDGTVTGTVLLAKPTGVDVTGDLGVTHDLTVTGAIGTTLVTESLRSDVQQSASTQAFYHTGDDTETSVTEGVGGAAITLTIDTNGRPVMVGFQSASPVAGGGISIQGDSGTAITYGIVTIKRAGAAVSIVALRTVLEGLSTAPGYFFLDTPVAGAHTYTATVQLWTGLYGANSTIIVNFMKLTAYEL